MLIHICIHLYTIRSCTCPHTWTHAYSHPHKYMYTLMCTQSMFAHTHSLVYVYSYMHTLTHTHTCTHILQPCGLPESCALCFMFCLLNHSSFEKKSLSQIILKIYCKGIYRGVWWFSIEGAECGNYHQSVVRPPTSGKRWPWVVSESRMQRECFLEGALSVSVSPLLPEALWAACGSCEHRGSSFVSIQVVFLAIILICCYSCCLFVFKSYCHGAPVTFHDQFGAPSATNTHSVWQLPTFGVGHHAVPRL